MTLSKREQDALSDYQEHTADHSLTVLRDDGEYRHLSFSHNGSNIYRFDLITWPGYLTICGDMGTYTFARIRDMFSFFRDDREGDAPTINPSYWAEKLVSVDKSSPVQEFSFALFKDAIKEEVDSLDFPSEEHRRQFWRDVQSHVLDNDYQDSETLMLARAMEFDPGDPFSHVFSDIYEHNFKEFTFHYLWVCYAIVDGIKQYDALKEEERKAQEMRWTPADAIKHIDQIFAIAELEEAGLVVEGQDEMIRLMSEGGPLFEPLQEAFRCGRKHGVSVAPRSRSFYNPEKVREAMIEAFKVTKDQALELMKNLNWNKTNRFEAGEIPDDLNKPLVVPSSGNVTFVDKEFAIALSQCPTNSKWSYTVLPVDLILTNNGRGEIDEPYAFYAYGIRYGFEASAQRGFGSREDALKAGYDDIAKRHDPTIHEEDL